MVRALRRRILLLALAGLAASALAPAAWAELDEIAMTQAEIQTFACARYEQLFAAYGVVSVRPGVRDTLLQRARAKGASEDQLARLERVYGETRESAATDGLANGSKALDVTPSEMTMLERQAAVALPVCLGEDFWAAELQVGAEKDYDRAAVNKDASVELSDQEMEAWQDQAQYCGGLYQMFASVDVEQLLHDLKGDFLRFAQSSGASREQVEILARLYEESREEARSQGITDGSYPSGIASMKAVVSQCYSNRFSWLSS